LEKIRQIKGIGNFRDAAFLSDNQLLLIDDAATLWEIHLSADSLASVPKQIIRGGKLLRPIAKAFGQSLNFWMKPAGGAYPRLIACPEKNLVVVNSHDFVCVAYCLNSRSTSEIVFGWGQYYPTLEFSPGGDFFVANVEGNLLVLDPTNWEFFEIEGEFKGSVFHSLETRLFCMPNGKYHPKMPLTELQAATSKGSMIVSVKSPIAPNGAHAIVLDGFENGFVLIRDPWPPGVGSAYKLPLSDFKAAFFAAASKGPAPLTGKVVTTP
jgi:hypothetical protein